MKRNILIGLAILVLFVSSFALMLKVGAADNVEPDFSTVTSSPYPLVAYSGNPVLTASMVTDRKATFVADPFLYRGNNVWYMFFEVEIDQPYTEEIGVANSTDGFHWNYMQIVLSDPQFRFSFPQVYEDNGTYYMVPDSCADSVRLYTTTNFPYGWTYVSTLVTDAQRSINPRGGFADPSLLYYNGYWWLFVSDWTNSNTYLYYSQSITTGWAEHPKSPIVVNDASMARNAGRTIIYNNGVILRFVQNCSGTYGYNLRAYQVDTLTTTNFAEHEIPQSPLLGPSGTGWNAWAMHTFGPWWTGTNWIVSTDGTGAPYDTYTVGIYTTQVQTPPGNGSYVLGDVNVESGVNYWGGQYDACKFQWTQPTGTYSGNISVYISQIASAPDNRMVVAIYDTSTNPSLIAGSAEKTGLTVGWNTQTLTGTFTLTQGAWYWLYVQSPSGNTNGRMTTGSIAGQHGWGNNVYNGAVPQTLSLQGTEQTTCSIYANMTQGQTPAPTTYTLTLSQSTGGTITSSKTTYNSGETALVTASASSGYSFNYWLVDGARPTAPYDTNNPLSLVMNADHTVQAVFAASPPPGNGSYVLGDVNVESGVNYWGGQYDACKFQWTQPTGTYSGSISVYISQIASAPDNRMVVAIYDTSTNPSLIAGSAEKTGLTVGWNTQTLTGTFTLTSGNWYWLCVQSPSGNTNGRMTTGSIAGQHGWGNNVYNGAVPQTLSLQGTEQTTCSIYANMTQGQTPPGNGSYVLGDVNVESGVNYWGGQYDACKFQWTQPTGTYSGSISVYISQIASAPDNRMVVAIYDTSTNPSLIAGSAEKTGLTVGWNTQTLTGTFTLTSGNWYWLYVQSPSGNTNGRMTTGSIAGQHGWGNNVYNGAVPQTLSLQGTEQTTCSIYANMTQQQTPP